MQSNGIRYYRLTPNQIWQQLLVSDVYANFSAIPIYPDPDPGFELETCQQLRTDYPMFLLPDNTIVLICKLEQHTFPYNRTSSIIFLKGVGQTYYPYREYFLSKEFDDIQDRVEPFQDLYFNLEHNWVVSVPTNVVLNLHCTKDTVNDLDCTSKSGRGEGERLTKVRGRWVR
jgi:hypothetical protein